MKNIEKSGKKLGAIHAVILLLVCHDAMAYTFNPWSWMKPGTSAKEGLDLVNPPALEIVEPASNPLLRAPYQPCSVGTNGIMKKVEVTPCDSKERCPLYRGKNVTLDFEFIPSFPAKTVVGTLYGVLNSPLALEIKFGKPENLCESNQVECPLEVGKLYHYRTTVFIKPSYPRFQLDTKVLIEGDKEPIACALIPVVIANPTS